MEVCWTVLQWYIMEARANTNLSICVFVILFFNTIYIVLLHYLVLLITVVRRWDEGSFFTQLSGWLQATLNPTAQLPKLI